jgi:hypothetical protein
MLYVLFMCKCVLPPGFNPIAVDKYIIINYYVEQLHFIKGKGTREHTLVCWQFVAHVLKRDDRRVQRKFWEAKMGVIIWIEYVK